MKESVDETRPEKRSQKRGQKPNGWLEISDMGIDIVISHGMESAVIYDRIYRISGWQRADATRCHLIEEQDSMKTQRKASYQNWIIIVNKQDETGI